MDIAAFNAWRAQYDGMSYAEQQDFHDRVYADHKVQAGYALHGGLEHFTHFFERVLPELPKTYVLEIGGHRGELAHEMLNRFPAISVWCNVEICRAAVADSIFASPRYVTWVPDSWVWDADLPPSNVVVASHVVEHMRQREFELLLLNLPETVRYLALVAPLPEQGPTDWNGYHGSHILEVGWDTITHLLHYHGFEVVEDHRDFKLCSSR